MICPSCGTPNDAGNRFCLRCGAALSAPAPIPQAPPPPPAPLAFQPPPPIQPVAAPPTYPVPGQTYSGPAVSQPYAGMPQPGQFGAPTAYGAPTTTGLNIWGPFAGYGARRRHTGWLMQGESPRAEELIQRVDAKLKDRAIPDVFHSRQTLTARGVVVESRPYFLLRRGLVTMGLYIAQFGRDLFVSLVSYLKPPISNFRVGVVGVMAVFWLYMTFGFTASLMGSLSGLANSFSFLGVGGGASNPGDLITLLCVIGPLGAVNNLALFLLLIYSGYKWLTDRDFWAALRVPPNEFNEDDLMAMEKAVEETLRQSLTDLRLNPDELKTISTSGGNQLF